jgi:predicted transcriptional regulator
MAASTTRDKILDAVRQLPPDATVEDAIERLLFLAKIERGLAQADAGQLIPHEEAKRRLLG